MHGSMPSVRDLTFWEEIYFDLDHLERSVWGDLLWFFNRIFFYQCTSNIITKHVFHFIYNSILFVITVTLPLSALVIITSGYVSKNFFACPAILVKLLSMLEYLVGEERSFFKKGIEWFLISLDIMGSVLNIYFLISFNFYILWIQWSFVCNSYLLIDWSCCLIVKALVFHLEVFVKKDFETILFFGFRKEGVSGGWKGRGV